MTILKKYQHAGIAGKFRLIHLAHVELLKCASDLTEVLHIFIVDMPEYQRYCSIAELLHAFADICATIDITNYQFHIIQENVQGIAWDQKLLALVPQLEVMFDSKEQYGNLLVQNEFLKLKSASTISVTEIEEHFLEAKHTSYIAPQFLKYMKQTKG